MTTRMFNRNTMPWIVAAILAVVLVAVLFSRGSGRGDNTINGVVQDSSGRRVLYWADPMIAQGPPHVMKSNKPGIAPDCQMKLVPVYADGEPASGGTTSSTVSGYSSVSLSTQRQQLIGVKLGKAEIRDLSRTSRTAGVIATDETRLARIQTKLDGFIERLYVNFTGAPVRRGQPLLSIYSPDLLATQQELLLAKKSGGSLGTTLYESARRRLLLWDMGPDEINQVVRTGRPLRSITLRSPVDGVVLTKTAVLGNHVTAGDTLYAVADLREVWVLADVYDSDLPYIHAGDAAQITSSSYGGRSWPGRVSFVPPTVDPTTRTSKVRINLANPDGALRPDMYVDVTLQQAIGRRLAVPEAAVLKTGTRSVVFVATGDGRFDPRTVETGAHVDGFWEIRQGVSPGETVVTDANFLVDSESRLKSAMDQMGSPATP